MGYLSTHFDAYVSAVTKPQEDDFTPPISDIIEWLCLTIDAHLPLLLVAKSEWSDRISSLRTQIRNEVQLCEAAVPVHSFLAAVTRGKRLPVADIPDYRIETVRF